MAANVNDCYQIKRWDVISLDHGILWLAVNVAHGTAFWSQRTEAVGRGILAEEPRPEDYINSLRPRQKGRHFADDIFKRIFLNENIRISTKNSLKFVPKGLINNIPALVLIMAWRRSGDKPLSEPMLVRSLTHICVTRPQ